MVHPQQQKGEAENSLKRKSSAQVLVLQGEDDRGEYLQRQCEPYLATPDVSLHGKMERQLHRKDEEDHEPDERSGISDRQGISRVWEAGVDCRASPAD